MRRWYCLAALVAGLLAAQAGAQSIPFGTSQGNGSSRLAANTQRRNIGPSTYLGSSFRLRDLFRTPTGISNRNVVGTSKIPMPGTPEYLKAFGYKKLY